MAKPDPLEQLVPVPADMVGPITESLAGHVLVLLNSEIQNMGERPGELTAASVYKVLKDFEMVFLDNLKSGASKTSPGEKDNSVSAALRRAFDKLRSDVMELPWDKLFSEQQVKKFVKRYDGFQQHLVSPELALRALIKDALDTVKPMALDLVNRAHSMLLESARLSAIDAQYVGMGQRAVRGSAVGRVSRFPMLENEMMPVITRTLESYRQTSAELAETLVDMERDCVTVSFFRKLQFSRLQRAVILIERDELGAGSGDESAVSANRQDDDEAASDDGSDDGSAVSVQISPELEALNTPEKLQRQSLRKQPGFFDPLTKIKREDWREDRSPRGWMLGVMRKRAHETGRFRSDKARWQQRYFAYSDDTHELYYWKSIPASDERARADLGSAQVYIPNCIVKQVNASEAEGAPEGQASQLPRVFSVTSKINGGIINRKGHRKMYLMAASGGAMFQWTARLSNSSTAPTRQGSGASVGDDSPTAGKVNPLKRPTLEVDTGGEGEEEGGEGGDVMNDPSLPRTPTGSYHMGDLGLGSPFFDSEELKREGRLRPAPLSMLRPAKDIAAGKGMFYKVLDEEGNLREKERGEMVVQMGQDAKTYSMAICDSLHTNLPKVVMYEQVERAEKELASSLQGEFLGLSKDRQNQLLQEDPMMESRRAMAVHCREELHDLLDKLRDPAQPQDEKDRDSGIRRVPAKALVLAGLTNHPTFPPAIKGHATAKQLVEAMYGKMSPQAILQAAAGPAESLRYYLDESRRQQRRAAKASSAAEGGAPPNDRPPPHPEAAARGTPPPGSQPQRRASSGPSRGPPMVPQASGPSMSRRPAPVAPPNLSRTSGTGSFSAPQRSAPSRPNQH